MKTIWKSNFSSQFIFVWSKVSLPFTFTFMTNALTNRHFSRLRKHFSASLYLSVFSGCHRFYYTEKHFKDFFVHLRNSYLRVFCFVSLVYRRSCFNIFNRFLVFVILHISHRSKASFSFMNLFTDRLLTKFEYHFRPLMKYQKL